MDSTLLAKALGIGFATGISTLLMVTLIVLPASYVMNKFIYHNAAMRIIIGIITVLLPIISFIVVACMVWSGSWAKVHYFGLIPVYPGSDAPQAPEGYLAFLFTIFNVIIHPFLMIYDEASYVRSMDHMLVPEHSESKQFAVGDSELRVYKGAVCELFSSKAVDAGAISNAKQWKTSIEALENSGIGEYIFTPSE